MSKIIKFIPNTDKDEDLRYAETPLPSDRFIPEWWKKQSLEIGGSPFDKFSFKACVPFLDSLMAGYMIYTNQDIVVSLHLGKPLLNWQVGPEPLVFRGNGVTPFRPTAHHDFHFAWKIPFGYILPKNYSVLITHPLNRFDLPFTTVSGIVDNGVPWNGQFTFWLKENFEGIIPKGTPIAQMIPFKTESWKSERAENLIQYAKDKSHEKLTFAKGYYKKYIHSKKKFE